MNEKQIKVLALLGKVSGVVTLLSAKAALLPDKYAWVGVVVVVLSSTLRDTCMWLGDLWDDGKLNQSFKGDLPAIPVTAVTPKPPTP